MSVTGIKFSDNIILEGSFKILEIDNKYNNIRTLYEDHNQIQALGANVLCRLLCTGYYGTSKPSFSNIKASTSTDTVIDPNTSIPIGIPIRWSISDPEYPGPPRLPGDPLFPEQVVEADTFTSTPSSNLYKGQYITNEGIFLNPPPSTGEISSSQNISSFHHFGLYISSFSDIEEYLFAYRYSDAGFSYPVDFGLRIVWTINFNTEIEA